MRGCLLGLAILLLPLAVWAEPGMNALNVVTGKDGNQTYSLSLQILFFMTVLTLLPSLLLGMTSFTRIVIVLAILRQALGTGQTPSNQILVGLALFLTFFVMTPVFDKVYGEALQPYLSETITAQEAVKRATEPLRNFMVAQTRESDLNLFVEIAQVDKLESRESVPLSILMPSFITSELKTAFQIGFLIFIPFLIIDLVVASVLMSMGMMMLSPMIISLPFKLMLFVLVDGWALIVGTLATSFYV